LVQQLRFFN